MNLLTDFTLMSYNIIMKRKKREWRGQNKNILISQSLAQVFVHLNNEKEEVGLE